MPEVSVAEDEYTRFVKHQITFPWDFGITAFGIERERFQCRAKRDLATCFWVFLLEPFTEALSKR